MERFVGKVINVENLCEGKCNPGMIGPPHIGHSLSYVWTHKIGCRDSSKIAGKSESRIQYRYTCGDEKEKLKSLKGQGRCSTAAADTTETPRYRTRPFVRSHTASESFEAVR